jgi:hypothetical protein
MKSIKFITAVLFSALFLFSLTSCGGGSKKNSNGMHTHDDGSVHGNHATDEASKPKEQETYKVEADSTTTTTNPAHEHDHGDGKPHKH